MAGALGSMPLPRAGLRGVRVSPVPGSPGAREVAHAPMVRLGGLIGVDELRGVGIAEVVGRAEIPLATVGHRP